jgi:hypothetical protein
MSLLGLIIAIAVIGLLVWAITTYIPMPPGFKKAIFVLAIICIVIFILVALGLWDQAKSIQVPKL